MFRLLAQHGVSPSWFCELTYPQVVCIMTRGKPDGLTADCWRAKKALADLTNGVYGTW